MPSFCPLVRLNILNFFSDLDDPSVGQSVLEVFPIRGSKHLIMSKAVFSLPEVDPFRSELKTRISKFSNDETLYHYLTKKFSDLKVKQLLFKLACYKKGVENNIDYRLSVIKCGGMKAATDIILSSKRNGKLTKAKFDLPPVTVLDTYYLNALKEVSHIWSRAPPSRPRKESEGSSTRSLKAPVERKQVVRAKRHENENLSKQNLEEMIKSLIWSKVENQLDSSVETGSSVLDSVEISPIESPIPESEKLTEIVNEETSEEISTIVAAAGSSPTPTSTESPVSSMSREASPMNLDEDDVSAIVRFKKYSNIIRTRNRGKINDPFTEEVIEFAERPDDSILEPNFACGEIHCLLGCVCDSVKTEFVRQDSCGLIECIFNCTCKPVLLSFSGTDDEAKPVFAFVAQRPKRNVRPPSKISDFAVITSTYQRKPKEPSDSSVKFEISPRRKLTLLGHDAKKQNDQNRGKVSSKRTLDAPKKSLTSSLKESRERSSSPKLQRPEVPLKKILLDKMSQKSSFSPQLTAWLLRQQKKGQKKVKKGTKTKSPINSEQLKISATITAKKGFKKKEQARKIVKKVEKCCVKRAIEKPTTAQKVAKKEKKKKPAEISKKKERREKPPRKKAIGEEQVEEEMIDLMIDGSDEGDDFLDDQNQMLNTLLDSVISEMPPDTPSSSDDMHISRHCQPEEIPHSVTSVSMTDKIVKPSLIPVDAFLEAALQSADDDVAVKTELSCNEEKENHRDSETGLVDEIPDGEDSFEKKYPFMRRSEYVTDEDKMICARTDSVKFLRSCARCRPVSSRYFAKNKARAKQTEIMEKWRTALLEKTLVAVEEGEESSDSRSSNGAKVKDENLEKAIDECKDFSEFESRYVYLNGDCVEIFSNCNWSSKRLKIYETIIRHMSNPQAFKIRLGVFSVEIIGNESKCLSEKGRVRNGAIKTPTSMDDVVKTVLIRDCSRADFTNLSRENSPKTPEEKPIGIDVDLIVNDLIGATDEKLSELCSELATENKSSFSSKSNVSESSPSAFLALCDEKLSDMPNLDQETSEDNQQSEEHIRQQIHLYKCRDLSRIHLNALLAKRNPMMKKAEKVDTDSPKIVSSEHNVAKEIGKGTRKLMVLSRLDKTAEAPRTVTKYRPILPRDSTSSQSSLSQSSSSKRKVSESERTDSEDSDAASTKRAESFSSNNNNGVEVRENTKTPRTETTFEPTEMYFKAPCKVQKVAFEERSVSKRTRSATSEMVQVTANNSFTGAMPGRMNASIARAISQTWLQHTSTAVNESSSGEQVDTNRSKSEQQGTLLINQKTRQLSVRRNTSYRRNPNELADAENETVQPDTASVDSTVTSTLVASTNSSSNETALDSVSKDETVASSLGSSWVNGKVVSSSEYQPSSPGSNNSSSTKRSSSTDGSNPVLGNNSCEKDTLAARIKSCCTNSVVS